MVSAAQVKATTNYIKNHTTRYTIQCNNDTDSDIIEFMKGVDNRNAFIKKLIRDEMCRVNR